jgi:hypothetical protein
MPELKACGCPEQDGRIYHQRETCTDPLVARLDWYGTLHDSGPDDA